MVIRVLGRMYFVDIIWNLYFEEDLEDFERKVVEKILEIYDKELFGDIFFFFNRVVGNWVMYWDIVVGIER